MLPLQKLRLKRNQIEFLSDGAFYISGGVIEEISLDRNKIDKVQKGWLYGLDNLRYLSLANNRIDYIATDGWDTLKNLEELDMRSNKLQLLDRESLCSLPELRFLYLQDNRISHIDGEEGDGYCSERTFGDVPLLEELYLDGNEISHTIEVCKKHYGVTMFFELSIIQIVHVVQMLSTSHFSLFLIYYFNLYLIIKASFSS